MVQVPFFDQVYAVVRRIPPGKVSSYGQIAAMLGSPRGARAVGYALRALVFKGDEPEYSDIPWQRVLNAKGGISLKGEGLKIQAEILIEEGIHLNADFIVDMKQYGWDGLLPHEVASIIDQDYGE